MNNHTIENKRIAKNTGYLYLRMLLQLAIGLYTSRIVLNALGVVDYGIYNVVGSLVAMFTFLNGTLSTTTTRFLNYNMVDNNPNYLRSIVCTSRLIHLFIGIAVVLFAETFGLYYLYHYLIVPSNRFVAAVWCYHVSVISCFVIITNVPNNAMIIANEKMSAFAYFSIYDVTVKLIIAFVIVYYFAKDQLVFYSILLLIGTISYRIICQMYCYRHFPEARGERYYDFQLMRKMTKFAGWIVNGSLAVVLYNQGLNLLINAFFGPSINAARGIAVQVQSKIMSFCTNFQQATIPQITKSYASGDYPYLQTLVINTTKYSLFLMYFLSFPIIVQSHLVLSIWLGVVPEYTVRFLQIILVNSIIESLKTPLNTCVHATGNIKKFQIIEGGTLLTILPFSYVVLKIVPNPCVAFVVQMLIFIIVHIIRSYLACPMIKLTLKLYYKNALIKPFLVLLPPSVIVLLTQYILLYERNIFNFAIILVESFVLISLSILCFGCDQSIRNRICRKLAKICPNIFRRC